MSFLDHIAACNNFTEGRHRPFVVDGARVGHVDATFAEILASHPDIFVVAADSVGLNDGLKTYDARTRAVDCALRAINSDGLGLPWRDENYPVLTAWGREPFFEMERAAVRRFGVRAFGVHINGYVRRSGGGLDMWIGRRSGDRAVCPGMLDNMVAGGQPAGLGLMENVIKECGEEADVPPELAAAAHAVGAISYVMETADGVSPDTMFCYDLELPDDFVPRNTDGEIASFERLPIEEVAAIVDNQFAFKFNCNLVIIDFLIRHGVLPPEHPDYLALLRGLRREA